MIKIGYFRRLFVRFGFRIGAIVLIIVGLLYYEQKEAFKKSYEWFNHTSKVLSQLNAFQSHLKFGADSSDLAFELLEIKNLTSDNLAQQERVYEIETLTRDTHAPNRKIDAGLEKSIVTIVNRMIEEENRLSFVRSEKINQDAILLDLPIILGGIFACLLVFIANKVSREDIERLKAKDREISKSRDEISLQSKIFQLLVESMGEGVVYQDQGGTFRVFNKRAQDLMGYSLKEMQESTDVFKMFGMYEASSKKLLQKETSALGRAKRGEIVDDLEIIVDNPRIPTRLLSFTARAIKDGSGNDFGSIAIFRDITAKKAFEEQLKLAQKNALETAQMKSQFLANMSHEVRTPINGIVGIAQILDATPLDEMQKSYVSLIQESCQSLMAVVNDVLDFSKVEAGKLEIEKEEFDLIYSVDKTIQILSHKARQKNLPILLYVDPQIPKQIFGDSGRLNQILLNLISNAIKFTDSGKVIVRVLLESETATNVRVHFEVCDSGVGLSPEQSAKLFQPFTQADSSTSRKYGGTGLGLSISKQLVELMQGSIGVDAIEQGGSKFWFKLPFEKAKKKELKLVSTDFQNELKVLILDRDLDSNQILKSYLESWSIRTTAFSDFDKLGNFTNTSENLGAFDLFIVSSFKLDEQVWELLKTFKSNPLYSDKKIFVVSMDESKETRQKLMSLGVDSYLLQPVEPSLLFNNIAKLFVKTEFKKEDPNIRTPAAIAHKNGRILLAEDNQINQLIARTFLTELGYSVQAVSNGQEVLDMLKQATFDLILMDCQMPILDGLEATQSIRQSGNQIPIIALTANAMKGDQERCLEVGMNDYMTKPFKKTDLQTILNKWLSDSVRKIS